MYAGLSQSLLLLCRVKGSEEYAELSKQCFVDMMKASKLRGNAGLFSLLMATALLIRSLLDSAYGLMATSSFGQAQKILHEAQQVQLPFLQGNLCQDSLCVPFFTQHTVCCNIRMCAVIHPKHCAIS